MHFSKMGGNTTMGRGYSIADALLAIKLLAKDRGILQKDLAEVCGMHVTSFNASLSGYKSVPSKFQPFDLEKIAKHLSKQYEGAPFTSIESMIAFAQANCELSADKKWQKTVSKLVSLQAEPHTIRNQSALVPEYMRAAKIICREAKIVLSDFSNKQQATDTFLKYILGHNSSLPASNEEKFEKLTWLAGKLGEKRNIPDFDVDAMLAEAKKISPLGFSASPSRTF